MNWYPKFRDVHLWAGLIVLIPVVVIAATGIGLNHEELFGLKGYAKAERDGTKSGQGKEGRGKGGEGKGGDKGKSRRDRRGSESLGGEPPAIAEMPGQPFDEKASSRVSDRKPRSAAGKSASFDSKSGSWNVYATAMDEAVEAARGVWGEDVALERIELKHESYAGMVVKVKASRSAKVEPDEVIWSVAERTRLLRPEDRGESGEKGTNWGKVIKDLHTGKFFSKEYGYFWSDVSAGALVLLSLTGLVLYLIPVFRKAAKKNKVPAAKPVTNGARLPRPRVVPETSPVVASVALPTATIEPQPTA